MRVFDSNERGLSQLAPGLGVAILLAIYAAWIAESALAQRLGLSTLTLAILLGILIGNSVFSDAEERYAKGLEFTKSSILRLGIILYGFRLSFSEVATVGWNAALISVVMVVLTFSLAVLIGTRLLKLDRETTILIGAGSAICGAAAVMATVGSLKSSSQKSSVAIATVVVFGTLSMFVYPLVYPYLGLSEFTYGIFVGSTIHEVAQVVVAGGAVSHEAEAVAVITKMLRVVMLAPFLIFISYYIRRTSAQDTGRGKVSIPWFALAFLLVIGFNSLDLLSPAVVASLVELDTMLLAVAMAALGLRTSTKAISDAGMRPLGLGIILFIFLGFGGYLINTAATAVL